MGELETRIDNLEGMIAQLTAAYAEVWVVVESILNEVMTDRTKEEKEFFWSNLNKVRVKMFEDINKVGKGDVDGDNPDLADAMENLVTGKPTDKTS